MKEIKVTTNIFGVRILEAKHEQSRFEVVPENSGWRIISVRPWYRTDAMLAPLWDKPPLFPNLSQAYKWLKENLVNLV